MYLTEEDNQPKKRLSEAEKTQLFRLATHPVYYRSAHGDLLPAAPGSPEAGYKRDPHQGNKLIKL